MTIKQKDILEYRSQEYDLIEYYLVSKVEGDIVFTRDSTGQETEYDLEVETYMKVLKHNTEEWKDAFRTFIIEINEYREGVLKQLKETDDIIDNC